MFGIFVIVWMVDIVVYFFGKIFGKYKLVFLISLGKIWEGVIGVVVGVVIYGLVLW